MTKMKMPELNIVRFNESDVIVASGGVPMGPLGINGFTTPGTGMMTYNDIDYTNSNKADLIAALGSGYTTVYANARHNSEGNLPAQDRDISNMFFNNQGSSTFSDVATSDGAYYWNSSNHRWEYGLQ